MDVKNCKDCGRLFNYVGGVQLCPACKDKLEDKFKEVKDFIQDNGKSTLEEVSEKCEVSVKQLKQWIREERLTFSDDSPITVECESCGAPIKSGRFCKNCSDNLANGFKDAFAKPVKQEKVERRATTNKMRFLDN